jgi:oligopeptide transport system substrate-binding protein
MRIQLRLLLGLVLLIMVLGSEIGAVGVTKAGLASQQVVRYNLREEPEILDPARSTGTPEGVVEVNCFEGLAAEGPHGNPVPGVAKKWTVSPDGKVYTFTIRNNAKWANGDSVTARDFEYSWKRTLNPKTASEYAGNLYVILNAEAYNSGKITDASQVGVKALDKLTLQVTLEAPCSYFPALTIHHSLFAVNRKVVSAHPGTWANNPKTYIGNGPFKLVKWVHHEKLEFVPNPYYWNRSKVKLTKLVFYTVEEQSTALTMFETNQADLLDELPIPELPRLKAAGLLKYIPWLGTYYYMFNVKKPPFNDLRVRKALTLAVNRAQLIKYVTKAGQKPALAFVPYGLPDCKPRSSFRKVGGAYFKDGDIARAKKLLAAAGYANPKKLPAIEILYNTSESHKQIAEALQEMWTKHLGIKVTLTNQEWKVYLSSRDQGDFQLVRAGWIADYADPMTFLDMWMTGNGNNDTGWSNTRYDNLIRRARNTGNNQNRLGLLHRAEKILMTELPIMPIYFYTRPYLLKDRVKGVRFSVTSMIYFSEAYVINRS